MNSELIAFIRPCMVFEDYFLIRDIPTVIQTGGPKQAILTLTCNNVKIHR